MNKDRHSHEPTQDEREEKPASGGTRRNFIRAPLGLAAGSIAVPSLLDSLAIKAKADGKCNLTLAPRYYPLAHFAPQIDLSGKLAVITGASRGNGRAVGEALTALGVDVAVGSQIPMPHSTVWPPIAAIGRMPRQ
jgi:hypothetical protein